MAFCTKCGKQLAVNARFCTGCGIQVLGGPPPAPVLQPPVPAPAAPKEKNYSEALTAVVAEYLSSKSIEHTFADENGKFIFEHEYGEKERDGEVFEWRRLDNCKVIVQPRWKDIVVRLILPFKVPEDKRKSVAEYLIRANYSLMIGAFEMDFSDGEIAFRNALLCDEAASLDLVAYTIDESFLPADVYGGGAKDVIDNILDPENANKEAQQKWNVFWDKRMAALEQLDAIRRSFLEMLDS